MNGDEILDVGKTAILLHAESETVLQFARKGELAGTRIGKSWVFLREDVIAFLKTKIERDTEERRRQTMVPANAVLLPLQANKRRRQVPPLPPLPASPANG